MSPRIITRFVACVLLTAECSSPAGAQPKDKKPGGGGGGGTTYSYTLTDLLGCPSQGCQSRAYYLTNRDLPNPDEDDVGGSVLVYGVSRTHVDGKAAFILRDGAGMLPVRSPAQTLGLCPARTGAGS